VVHIQYSRIEVKHVVEERQKMKFEKELKQARVLHECIGHVAFDA
jgi:hypothetical protein